MSKTCEVIDFPHCDQFESINVCHRNYHLNHIIDYHISQNIEIWARRTRINESLLRKFVKCSASRPSNYILYKALSKLLFAAIRWSANQPLYIKLKERVTKTTAKSQNSNKVIFFAKEGYIVFADSKPSKLHINTAYFPVVINTYDSNYQVFSRTFKHLKMRYYVNRIIRDNKYGQIREIADCSFVTHDSWRHIPPIEEYNEM